MKELKCQYCGLKSELSKMKCYSKPTGKYNKNGSEKILRKYVHLQCDESYQKEIAFKENELKELDSLYSHLVKLHNIDVLDGRMMEKIHDLRNGTVKIKNKKIQKYKKGVPFRDILYTYELNDKQLKNILSYMVFETKWNEFSYLLGTVVNNLADAKGATQREEVLKKRTNAVIKNNIETQSYNFQPKQIATKKDELDISDFL
ncbi:hypothetical protein [Bacillus atrophaeus]|uniref:hypothetical protein n=1 Tax=Bacillus atrophaeus TaxID=1452 RepID=UPI002DBDD6B4|nr:hypothetical protein [Bacillus atrophaeus]MEC2307706.1 hypothetical protein [Bacillus atrophaeus]